MAPQTWRRNNLAASITVVCIAIGLTVAEIVRPVPTAHPRVDLNSADATALDQYVHEPDASFSYEEIGTVQTGPGFKVHTLKVTSQTWLTPEDFVTGIGHVWWHYVSVIVPDKIVVKDKALMYITGGDNTDSPPTTWKGNEDIELAIALAVSVQSCGIVVFQTPNQPIMYADDVLRKNRSEDANIAFTWDHFYRMPTKPEWLLRLPMTKGAVRAMDAVEHFLNTPASGLAVAEWAVAGASKRGWTTWTTAAVDTRVVCIAPVVLDVMHLVKTMHRWYTALGGWTFAVKDYYDLNFTQKLDDPQTKQMFTIVDPAAYIDRYTMPKLAVNAGGDEFLEVDDSYAWYNEMPGETHLLMVQDADHSMATGLEQVIPGIASFMKAVFKDRPRPKLSWKFDAMVTTTNTNTNPNTNTNMNTNTTNSITVELSEPASSVRVWHADTIAKTRRDWRFADLRTPCPTKIIPTPGGDACFQPVFWTPSKPKELGNNTYQATFSAPTDGGWRAYFIVADFEDAESEFKFKLTTQVRVVPETFPFPACSGVGCRGTLV